MFDAGIETLEIGSEYPLMADIGGNGAAGRWRRIGTLARTATALRVSLDRRAAWIRPAAERALSAAPLYPDDYRSLVLGVFVGRGGVTPVARASLTRHLVWLLGQLASAVGRGAKARDTPRLGLDAPRPARAGWLLG